MPSFFETFNKRFYYNTDNNDKKPSINYNKKFIRPIPEIPKMDPIKKYAPKFNSLPNYITYPHPEDKYFSKDLPYPKGILYPKFNSEENTKNILNVSEDKNIQVSSKDNSDNTIIYLLLAIIVGYLVCKNN